MEVARMLAIGSIRKDMCYFGTRMKIKDNLKPYKTKSEGRRECEWSGHLSRRRKGRSIRWSLERSSS